MLISKTKKKEQVDFVKDDPEYKPFIVMNEYLQVWTGLKDGGLTLTFSDNFDDAKPLNFYTQFLSLKRIYKLTKLEQIYL
jgi:hypothetical protein